MNIKSFIPVSALALASLSALTGCQKGDNLQANPNAVVEGTPIPVSLILNHITANFIRTEELPLGNDVSGTATLNPASTNGTSSNVYKLNQAVASNYSKYWGNNEYSWSYTGHSYDLLKYAIKLENEAATQLGNKTNRYFALSKFFRAYSAIWLSQRVGDIPMTQAGDPAISTPAFDTQKDVYKNSLTLLDDANTILSTLITALPSLGSTVLDGGDIYGLTYTQWQKLINTYRLRVLISLSKRAEDAADLNIKQQFATILGNPTKYPVMTSNSDNLVYKFNAAYNTYPNFAIGNKDYNNFLNPGKTILDITTATKDPRTFLIATPAAAQRAAPNNKPLSDFTAYVGADSKLTLAGITEANNAGTYSFLNAKRYFTSNTGANAEPFIFIGYPEMCFNIAEAITLGWTSLSSTDAKSWYDKGIAASMSNFGLSTSSNSSIAISDVAGNTLGNVTTDMAGFLTAVAFDQSSTTNALQQILTQKYVALFLNSGSEAFYNYRRTGIPAFSQGGGGIGTPNSLIPRRWLYPLDEINYNNANYKTSVQTQFAGNGDDVKADTWLTK